MFSDENGIWTKQKYDLKFREAIAEIKSLQAEIDKVMGEVHMRRKESTDKTAIIKDLALLVRRLSAGQKIKREAINYLERKGLVGSVLRFNPHPPEKGK